MTNEESKTNRPSGRYSIVNRVNNKDGGTPETGEKRQFARIPIKRKVALNFGSVDITETVTDDLSHGGMFIRTGQTIPLGTTFDFLINLGDSDNLIEGTAEVVRIVMVRDNPEKIAGWGTRFLLLDEKSRFNLDAMLNKQTG